MLLITASDLDEQRVAFGPAVHGREQVIIRLAADDLGGKLAGVPGTPDARCTPPPSRIC